MFETDKKWRVADRVIVAISAVSVIAGVLAWLAEQSSMMLSLTIALAIFVCLTVLNDRYPEVGRRMALRLGWIDDEKPRVETPATLKSIPPYRPPHDPNLPIWLGMFQVLTEQRDRLEQLIAEGNQLKGKIQSGFEALARNSTAAEFPDDLNRQLVEWRSHSNEIQSLLEYLFSDRDCLGMRFYRGSATPFDLEEKLSRDAAIKYHRFRNEVNLWEEKTPEVLDRFHKEIEPCRSATLAEVRRLLVDAKK